MVEYLNSTEGSVGSDPACVTLFEALDRPGHSIAAAERFIGGSSAGVLGRDRGRKAGRG
jgi:hypothetical protein